MNLQSVLEKLKDEGYSVDIRNFDNVDYIFGGIEISEGNLKLGVEIRIKIQENEFVFLDSIKQVYVEKKFSNDLDLLNFIKQKYPIE